MHINILKCYIFHVLDKNYLHKNIYLSRNNNKGNHPEIGSPKKYKKDVSVLYEVHKPSTILWITLSMLTEGLHKQQGDPIPPCRNRDQNNYKKR